MIEKNNVYGFFCNGSIGKSRLASALGPAIKLSDPEKKVITLDFDFGGPSQEIYNQEIIKSTPGYIHNLIEDSASIDDIITKTQYPGYDLVLTDFHHKPTLDLELYHGLKKTIHELKKRYDVVLLDIGSTFDHTSTNSEINGGELSSLIDLADEKFLVSVANDGGKIMSRGVKTVRDYLFYSIKNNIANHIINSENSADKKTEYMKEIFNIFKKNYDKVEELTDEMDIVIKDANMRANIIHQIKKTVKNTNIGIVFNQLNNKTELFNNFIILGKEITNLSDDPSGIKINNMNGYGHFSYDYDLVKKSKNKPITCHNEFSYKTLYQELINSSDFFINKGIDKKGIFKKIHNKQTMDYAFNKYIEKERLEM